ncbi:MAG TPA: transglutaminase family protein, partial [Anaeromyxobacteraceae bacterium]|nr:transglutaminase family protein [Anaeromyxobacteraceae bacterium]
MRLRPANHARARVETYALTVPAEATVRWQHDPFGNNVALLTFAKGSRLPALEVVVDLAVDVRPVNPFDFFLDERCERTPFTYPPEVTLDLSPFLDTADPALAGGSLFAEFLAKAPRGGKTVPLLVELNQAVHQRIRYVVREEAGLWTPEETLEQARGSCRDQAVLLIALLRARGLAARFASGYLIQLTDEGMIPDQPKGVGRDVVDLHAWAEVYLPGAGWIGFDPTSGLLTGEGHVPLACVARPALAAPIEGTSDVTACEVSFQATVARLGHEARPTAPFTDTAWERLLAAGDSADAVLAEAGLALTTGGEPTFNARDDAGAPEWNAEALGPSKWPAAMLLAEELRGRLAPGAVLLRRQGKWYPGEPLPRWAIELVGRADGRPLWTDARLPQAASRASVHAVAEAIAARLGLAAPLPAYEDPWRLVQEEATLPVDVDPLEADLDDPDERRRLARLLGGGPGQPAGFVLPLAREDGAWRSEGWSFRRGHLFLIPGDSPIGLRLPLASLRGTPVEVEQPEPELALPDPRRKEQEEARQARLAAAKAAKEKAAVHTALAVEVREDRLHVFLPPLPTAEDFLELLRVLDAVRLELGLDLQLEGYPPAASPLLRRLTVAPD